MPRIAASALWVIGWAAGCGAAPAPRASEPVVGDDRDRDRDRIGAADRCPDAPETYIGSEDDDGCPDRAPPGQCVWIDTMRIAEELYFAPGATTLGPADEPLLDALAATLTGNPQVEHVAVVGGAALDESDPDSLAMARARATVASLVARGVGAARLEARGYGRRAAADREPARARAVWFVLLRVDGRPVHDVHDETSLAPYRLDCDAERARSERTGMLINCDCIEHP